MFSGTIQSIKIENVDEWAKDGAFHWTELQRNLRSFYCYFYKFISIELCLRLFFTLIYQHDFQPGRYFRQTIISVASIKSCPTFEKKLLNIGSLFVYNILPKFSRSSEIDGKNRKRDSRTRFQAKSKTFRKQLRIICTFVPFTILNIIHKY